LAAAVHEVDTVGEIDLSDDPAVAAWELVALAPLGSLDKQRLLDVDDHAERLRLLAQLAEDQSVLLRYRLDRE
jgi:Lon protease-like protein